MNKLYHAFCVYSYTGGELSYNINSTLEELVSQFLDYIDWEDLWDTYADDEKFSNMEDDEYFSPTCTQLVSMMDDETIKNLINRIVYPGNIYAFDTHSDYEIFTTDDDGKLVKVNIIEEPGFLDLTRKVLEEDAKYWDNRKKS